MRRKAKEYYPPWTAYNVLKDVDPERLKLIGAIALGWNFIEDMIDECLQVVTWVPFDLRTDLSSRINGLDGKFELIKKGARLYPILTQQEKEAVAVTIGAVADLKTYRDAIIHIRLGDPLSVLG